MNDALVQTPVRRRAGEREMVALLAALMALNAFALDTMLPALPQIGSDLAVEVENQRQLVILAYLFGFGSSQMAWGPLADRFGRKSVLVCGLLAYVGFGLLAAIASSFVLLIAARFLMGASGAVSRVLITAIVRDLYDGERMARVMSLTMMVFMVVPVIAPTIGQGLLLVGDWRLIFWCLAAYGLTVLAWGWVRLPETLKPEYRRNLQWRTILGGMRIALTDRLSLGYMLALTMVFGALTAYLASIQQIVGVTFGQPERIGLVFAIVAAPMSLASWGNSRIVERIGLRNVGHNAVIGMALTAVAHLLLALGPGESLWLFAGLQSLTFVWFAFTSANLSTLAMTNMAPIAGTASSVQGTVGSLGGALLGLIIGQSFDGTQIPYLSGIAITSVVALLIVLVTEQGRLFSRGPPRPRGTEHCPAPDGS